MKEPTPSVRVDDPIALPPGTRVGEIELRSVLGVGGFSIVYLAFDHALDREVAIKEYFPASLAARDGSATVSVRSPSDAEMFELGLRSFINEAKLLARFDHPSLLKVYRFWEANGTAYMTMSLQGGRTLRETRRGLTSPPNEAWMRGLLDPLLDAIGYLHEQGVYHRDIAPDNIVIDEGGRPVLLDFGAARHVFEHSHQKLTTTLKPAYAPVEQYGDWDSMPQGPWTDLYAVGATIYFMLVGTAPEQSISRSQGDNQTSLVSQAIPGYSVEFLRVIDWMLALRPGDRPQNVSQVREALALRLAPPQRTAAGPEAATRPPQTTAPNAVASIDPFASFGGERTVIRPAQAQLPEPRAAAAPPATRGWLRAIADWFGLPERTEGTERPAGPPVPRPPEPAPPAAPLQSPQPAPLHAGEQTVFASTLREAIDRIPASLSDADMTVILRTPSAPPAPATSSKVVLTVVQSDTAALVTRTFDVPIGETVIGRDDAAIALSDPQWSRRHALLQRDATGIRLSDLDSSNGSFVNGARVGKGESRELRPGHSIRIGTTIFVLGLIGDTDLPDLAGSTLGDRYVLLERLHASPKSAVYRAEKQRSKLPVAVKILSPQYASYPGALEQFHAEAHAAARLQHPHICSLDDFGDADVLVAGRPVRVPFLAYELLGGGSLRTRLGKLHDIELTTIEGWIGNIADALDHAHRHGVVHGNLKPSSIRFGTSNAAYLTDFAIADGAPSAPPLVGTPAFMSPERWQGLPPSPKDDQYSLGVVAYLLLAGQYPYEGQDDEDRRQRNFREPPVPVHQAARDRWGRRLSPMVSRSVAKALQADPAERYASVLDFSSHLSAALRSADGASVFFSYQRKTSSALVGRLKDRLERDFGISCFVDTQNLDRAGRFSPMIERAIEDASVFVCLLGAPTLKSIQVQAEVECALRHGKTMIPVFQEAFGKPKGLPQTPAVLELLGSQGVRIFDLSNLYIDAAVKDLASKIQSATSGSLPRPPRLDAHQDRHGLQ